MGSRTQKTCRDSPKTPRIDKTGTTETAKKRREQRQLPTNPAKETAFAEEKQILIQIDKYELTLKFTCGNIKLLRKTGKK